MEGEKKSWVITQVWSTFLYSGNLSGHRLCEFNGRDCRPEAEQGRISVSTCESAEAEEAVTNQWGGQRSRKKLSLCLSQ